MGQTIKLSVEFGIVDAARAAALDKTGGPVWTWCSRGAENWLERGAGRSDVLAYLVLVEPIDLPDDPDDLAAEVADMAEEVSEGEGDEDTDESEEPGDPLPDTVPRTTGKPEPFALHVVHADPRGVLMIPSPDPAGVQPYDIDPGYYDHAGLVALLRFHRDDPFAVQYIADMLE